MQALNLLVIFYILQHCLEEIQPLLYSTGVPPFFIFIQRIKKNYVKTFNSIFLE